MRPIGIKEIKTIKSHAIREMGLFLLSRGHSITYFGKAWSKVNGDWIYFDTVLDIDDLIRQFDRDRTLELHENTDSKSGLEKGLVDPLTDEAVMGLIKEYKRE